jgi:hypothetical protein
MEGSNMDPYWTDESAPLTQTNPTLVSPSPHAPNKADLERVLTALDDNYNVEDLGYAGDARIANLRDKLTGEYILTVTITTTS